MKIGLTYDLKDYYIKKGMSKEAAAEFDEQHTIDAIKKALKSLGHKVDDIGNVEKLLPKLIKGKKWDLVFNIAEGIRGTSRESLIPSLLEHYNVRHTFSDSDVLTVCLDKYLTKVVLEKNGILTPKFKLLQNRNDIDNLEGLSFPMFVKPVNEGTGKGINKHSKVTNEAELKKQVDYLFDNYMPAFLLEEYIEGKEITMGLSTSTFFGASELKFTNTHNFYCYENKRDYEKFVTHHNIVPGSKVYKELDLVGRRVFEALGVKDIARIDLRQQKGTGKLYVIEINPIPGLNPIDSELPIVAYKNNISYKDIIKSIVEESTKRSN